MTKGRVLKILSDRFAVDCDGVTVVAKSRKKIKREALPVCGDIVELDKCGEEYVITGIMSRNNYLIRPPVANVDRIIITVAPLPEPDFFTLDKIIVNALKCGVKVTVCVNKTDIAADSGLYERIAREYCDPVDSVICSCAARGDVEEVKKTISGFTCFAGQSAVGKTSIINAICGCKREVGELSEKTLRGKNTTVGAELLKTEDGSYVADTPGFGALDIFDIPPSDLHLYYAEYVRLADGCKYRMCTHTAEPSCAVKEAVKCGRLNAQRYERYCAAYEELKKKNLYTKLRRNLYENK